MRRGCEIVAPNLAAREKPGALDVGVSASLHLGDIKERDKADEFFVIAAAISLTAAIAATVAEATIATEV